MNASRRLLAALVLAAALITPASPAAPALFVATAASPSRPASPATAVAARSRSVHCGPEPMVHFVDRSRMIWPSSEEP